MPGGPYAEAAGRYRDAGWLGVLPVGTGPAQKTPPPGGYSGHDGTDPEEATVAEWCQTRGDRNIALRLPEDVVGIDIDAYTGKAGAATLQELQTRLGPLPDTWTSTSREDGVSGIRLYRTPPGFRPRRDLTGGVELVWRGHRYVVCAPSIHPDTGNTYRWVSPGGQTLNGAVPGPGDLPELPAAWADYLQATPTLADPGTYERATVADKLAEALGQLAAADAGGRHDAALRGAHSLANYVVAGHPDAEAAMGQLGEAFVAAVMPDRPREARAEWQRIRDSALRKVEATGSWAAPPEPTPEATGGPAAAEPLVGVDWDQVFDDTTTKGWLVPMLVPRGRCVSCTSDPKVGKSLLWFEIAFALAAGAPEILGMPNPNPGPVRVLYVDLEMTMGDVRDRIEAMGYGRSEIPEGLLYVMGRQARFTTDAGAERLVATVAAHDAELVVIDTMIAALGGDADENASTDIRALHQRTSDAIKTELGASVVWLDHFGKKDKKSSRGSGDKLGAIDIAWLLKAEEGRRGHPTLLTIKIGGGRTPVPQNQLQIERHADPGDLHHRFTTATLAGGTGGQSVRILTPKQAEIRDELDAIGFPWTDPETGLVMSRRRAEAWVEKKRGKGFRAADLVAVLAWAKEATEEATENGGNHIGNHFSEAPTGTISGTTPPPTPKGTRRDGTGTGSRNHSEPPKSTSREPGSPPTGEPVPVAGSGSGSGSPGQSPPERRGGGAGKARTLPSGEVVWPDHESYDQATEELP